tara:strand:- start:83 stop:631 length:549 start_codon:yes stop_codon:yes gene_type:complete
MEDITETCIQHAPPPDLPYTNWICYPTFLVGTYPRNDDVTKIKNMGITHFISLLEEKEIKNYYESRKDINLLHFPIPDRKIVSNKKALEIGNIIYNLLENGTKIFLHCKGGKGRTGTIAAIILIIKGLQLNNILKLLKKSIESRVIQGRCPKMPQTAIQHKQLVYIYNNIKNIKNIKNTIPI